MEGISRQPDHSGCGVGIYLPKFTMGIVSTNKREALEGEMCEVEAKESVAVKEIRFIKQKSCSLHSNDTVRAS